jgi:hypothetical protein
MYTFFAVSANLSFCLADYEGYASPLPNSNARKETSLQDERLLEHTYSHRDVDVGLSEDLKRELMSGAAHCWPSQSGRDCHTISYIHIFKRFRRPCAPGLFRSRF